jgi:hypothetical protein
MTPWVEASVQFMTLDDHLFLRTQMKISKLWPSQYGNTINYVSVKASKRNQIWKIWAW